MTDPAAILEVRHVRLAEQATLSPATLGDGTEGVFVALADPPPVRTVLAVVQGERRRALQVVSVVEVAEQDERRTRGFYGRFTDDEALARAGRVGTEHMEDGTPQVQPVTYDHSAALPMSDAHSMAMPAPVMMDVDDTGVIDVDDRYREDADDPADDDGSPGYGDRDSVAAASDDGAPDDDTPDGDPADSGVTPGDDDAAEPADGRKARGGRKKRTRKKR